MIDSNLQAELRAKFNPDGSDLRKMQMRMLEMLKFIDKICQENDIKYWLSSGTCLGAVRHGGFIPWDDDVDIEMLEADYIKFCNVMGDKPNGDFILQTISNEPSYIYPFAKLRDLKSEVKESNHYDENFTYRGLFIDIFHIKPSNSYWAHRIATSLHFRSFSYYKTNNISPLTKRFFYKTLKLFLFPFLQIIDKSKTTSQYRHSLGSHFYKPRDINDLLPTKKILFEGLLLPIPKNEKSYLTKIYGNYMNLPDFNKIIPHMTLLKLDN